jgi:hypothetical protein
VANLKKTMDAIATKVPDGTIVANSVLEARRRQRAEQRQAITTLLTNTSVQALPQLPAQDSPARQGSVSQLPHP